MTATLQHSGPGLLLYKIPDAMRLLRMSRSVIYEQIRAGRLRTVKQGRATFITAAAITDYIALLEREADAADNAGTAAQEADERGSFT
jgi:predicted DNA-binding transcriptional regulator AlpA